MGLVAAAVTVAVVAVVMVMMLVVLLVVLLVRECGGIGRRARQRVIGASVAVVVGMAAVVVAAPVDHVAVLKDRGAHGVNG